MTLYINACPRGEESRTNRLAKALLEKFGGYTELNLSEENLRPLTGEDVRKRSGLLEAGRTDDAMFRYARQFAQADTIVVSAPFWDGSFPSILKVYLENVYAIGIVTAYTPDGMPFGLCKAKKLYYVTTAGGNYFPDFGYGYLRALAQGPFGIPETELIFAENLDLATSDAEAILREAIEKIKVTAHL